MTNRSAELDRHSIPIRERINEWARSLFKATAYFTIILLDLFVITWVVEHFDQMTPAHWLLVGTLASVSTIMFPRVVKATSAVVAIAVAVAVLILLAVMAHAVLPWWTWIAVIIGLVVYLLFQKLDAINANIARSNELKRRELDLHNS